MSMIKPGPEPVEVDGEMVLYGDGRTKQSFKDETDINKLLARAAKGDSLSHLQKHGAEYGDFSDVDDLLSAHERLSRGVEIFAELPSAVRREFHNDMGAFFNFVNDPANAGKLRERLPELAKPGVQLPAVLRSVMSEANPALASTPPEAPPEAPVVSPSPPVGGDPDPVT